MKKVFVHVKPYLGFVVLIVILLFAQALGELLLPSYMSNIVDVGISKQGIDAQVPEALSKSGYQLIIENAGQDRAVFEDSYRPVNKGVCNEYPLNSTEEIYILVDGFDEEGLAAAFKNIEGVTGSAESFIVKEYTALGMDLRSIQNKYLTSSGVQMLGIALLIMICVIGVTFLSARVSAGVGRSLRNAVFEKVAGFSGKNLDSFSASTLITRSTNDIQQVQNLLNMLLRMVMFAPLMGIGGVIMVMRTQSQITWIIVCSIICIMTVVMIMFSVATPRFKIVQEMVDNVNRIIRESLTGMLVIRGFSNQSYEEERFDKANKELTGINLFITRLMGGMFPAMSIIMNFSIVAILWFGAHKVEAGVMEVGNMMAFIQYAMHIMFSFLMISMVSIMLPRAMVAVNRIGEVLSEEEGIKDPVNTVEIDTAKKGIVEFQNVSFKYSNAEADIVKNITFTANPGETTAIIGSTGSGKSTVVNLIPRFYDVTEGSIMVGGADVRALPLKELRKSIGYVPQKAVLFSGDIESNIKYPNHETSVSDEEMVKAARIAQAEDFIDEKHDKYNESISQGGSNVSGGQRQRLSIARALAKNPDIFIFDDSFSALDYKTDAMLRQALNRELSQATVIIVAQRISTIRNAEKILVLDEGCIVGEGTHKELIKTCEVYRQIAASQLSKEELE